MSTTPGTTYSYWYHGISHNPLAEQVARFMAENYERLAEVDQEGPAFHYVIRHALASPDEAATLAVLINGLADMQKQMIAMTKMAEAYARSRISAGIIMTDDPDKWMADFARRKEQQLTDEMRSPDA
jgi:hypothetical protein